MKGVLNMIIKLFRDGLREHMEKAASEAKKKFASAIRPIYAAGKEGKPVFIGSCILLEIEGSNYLLSAAHVIDQAKSHTIYVGGEVNLVLLEGDFVQSVAPNGVRSEDHYDFAWIRLADDFSIALGNVKFIEESEISQNRIEPKGRIYMAVGYPRSKNKKANPTTRRLRPKLGSYYSTWTVLPDLYSELGLSGSDHITIVHGYLSRNYNGNIVNSFGVWGMSGGALIDLGQMNRLEDMVGEKVFDGILAGLLIEKYEEYSAILSTKINLIIDNMKNGGR